MSADAITARSRQAGPGAQQLSVPSVRDGAVDEHGETRLTLRWMLRHVRKAVRLVLHHPLDVVLFMLRHPKKFFGVGRPAGYGSRVRLVVGPASAEVQAELAALFDHLEVDFFEVTAPDRIGHMAGEVDLRLKELVMAGGSDQRRVLVMNEGSSSNPHLFGYLREHFQAVISPATWEWLAAAVPEVGGRHAKRWEYYHAYDESAACYAIETLWGLRPPLFQLREADQKYLREVLAGWGLREQDWYVCFHNREPGYSKKDDHHHDYRNASVSDYLPAMEEVIARGGWVVRMGDSSMTPLPPMKQVVDYATSGQKSPRLDVLLCAGARFFIGCSSGLFLVPSVFGVPVGLVNLVPMSTRAMSARDIGIPKLYYSREHSRLLRFDEVFSHPMSNYRFSRLYEQGQIETSSNDAEDILGVTREMLAVAEGSVTYSEEDEKLQQTFNGFFQPGHYGYGSSARTGRDFLRRHRQLFGLTSQTQQST
jgi:putative glycosyltransferase (TIGR04372 family)